MNETSLIDRLREALPDDVIEGHARLGDPTAVIRPEGLLRSIARLKGDPEFAFDMLIDLTAIDHLGREPRFEVVYHLRSLEKGHRIRLKVPLTGEEPEVDSLAGAYAAADWYEREVFDMFGIRFRGHPNLRRILLYEGFEGHPLRKDYPIRKRQPIIGPEN